MTIEEQPLEQAATDTERSLWQLSRDEQRVLIITFVGGLASIIVGAVVLGGAAALAHYEQKVNSTSTLAAVTVGSAVVAVTSGAAMLVTTILRGRRAFRLIATVFVVMDLIVVIASTALFCLSILTWIGIAAGIH